MSNHTVAENIVNEVTYLERLNRHGVPEHLRDGLVRYLVHHIRPGHFLTAVLNNDLHETFARGDEDAIAGLSALMRFLENDVPLLAWGSARNFDRWIEAQS